VGRFIFCSNPFNFNVISLRFHEVHFGKFASFYISPEYYFDVRAPFEKLLFGLAGWFVGFDGRFTFYIRERWGQLYRGPRPVSGPEGPSRHLG
jgi:dolichyl-phosphate-mannose--protein O-mannosyl transferase